MPAGRRGWAASARAMDDFVQLYIAGTLAQFPDYAPSDALGVLGDEMGIDRGPLETDANYAARLTALVAWKYARRAGWHACGALLGRIQRRGNRAAERAGLSAYWDADACG